MNKRSFLFLGILLLFSALCRAERISEREAIEKAYQFLGNKNIGTNAKARALKKHLTLVKDEDLYIFNIEENEGFVIVAGDDRCESILGYSDRGHFDADNMPENFKIYLEEMIREIKALPRTDIYRVSKSNPAKSLSIHPKIDPLIITNWDQGNPDRPTYNKKCPLINEKHAITGCVATYGAQLMYYYQWPKGLTKPVPGYKITDVYGKEKTGLPDTSEDLPAIEFQWDKMKPRLSYYDDDVESTDAIAELMLYCGYAAQMSYGLSGSSASTETLLEGMVSCFDYDPAYKFINRENVSVSQWDEIIYNELASGRPVIYSGSGQYSGHSFLCDGYDGAGMYHFNWGWGGMYDGYYRLGATNPYGEEKSNEFGYIFAATCIIGVQPNTGQEYTDRNQEWKEPDFSATAGTVYYPGFSNYPDETIDFYLSNDNKEAFSYYVGLAEIANGSLEPIAIQDRTDVKTEPQSGNFVYFNLSSLGLSEGSHLLYPVTKTPEEENWSLCRPGYIYFEVIVQDGKNTKIVHPIENLQVNSMELVTSGVSGKTQRVNVSITNLGDDIEKEFFVYLGTEESDGEYVGYKNVIIPHGSTNEYQISIGSPSTGNYKVRLYDRNKNHFYASQDISIDKNIKATEFTFPDYTFASAPVKVEVLVENNSGDYPYPLYLFASQGTEKTLAYVVGAAIEASGQQKLTFYFTPNQAGIWNLWVATDNKCTDIIGETQVEIQEGPTGKVSMKKVSESINIGQDEATYTITLTNVSETDSYRKLMFILYKVIENFYNYEHIKTIYVPAVIRSGETVTTTVSLNELEEGADYEIDVYYSMLYDTDYPLNVSSFEFTFSPNGIQEGDANGDGEVNVADVDFVIERIGEDLNETNKSADVNGDGEINVADVDYIIERIK